MFSRTLSILLVAAIIACPLWCDSGLSLAGSRGSEQELAEQRCPARGTVPCCCNRSFPEKDDQAPCQCPNKSSCQGVCGGAVFEKPCELGDLEDSFFLTLTDIEVAVDSRLAQWHSRGVEHHHCSGGANYGRSLRTLHMSFLC